MVLLCRLQLYDCYVWDQTLAGRGALEIHTCLLDCFGRQAAKGVTEIEAYSDNCSYQNKNNVQITTYYVVSQKLKIQITHHYLEKGHTQMDCDSVDPSIDMKIKHTDIFPPSQWYGLIQKAKVEKIFYRVRRVAQEDKVPSKEQLKNYFQWNKVPISKLGAVKFNHTHSGTVDLK